MIWLIGCRIYYVLFMQNDDKNSQFIVRQLGATFRGKTTLFVGCSLFTRKF